jgi:hypothetical protein
MSAWHSLFSPTASADTFSHQLRDAAIADGYTPYNPFGLMPSKPYKITVRLFIAPPQNGWTRIVGEAPPEICTRVSAQSPLLRLSLRGADAGIHVYADGQEGVLEDWLRARLPTIDLASLNSPLPPLHVAEQRPLVVPLEALPEDVRRMAAGIDQKQAAKMFERISGDLMKKVGGDAAAAQALLQQGDAPDWNSAGGARIRQIAEALDLGDGWREPNFVRLRDAFQVAARRQRRPDAPPLPGDAEVLAAVPQALAYIPLFAGKDASE